MTSREKETGARRVRRAWMGAAVLAAALALPSCGGSDPEPRLEVAKGGEGDSWWASVTVETSPPRAANQEPVETVTVPADVLFDSGAAVLGPEAEPVLDELAALLEQRRGPAVVVGHTDAVGTAEDNLALGEARARAVLGRLVELGVDPDRLSVRSAGEAEPVDPDDAPSGRARNRRVEVELPPA